MKNINLSVLVLSLFFSTAILAQKTVIDSLENELVINNKKDTTRVNNFDQLSYLYYRNDIKKAKEYIDKAEVLAKELAFKKGIANAIYMRGVVAMVQSKYDLSISYFEEASQIYSTNGLKSKMSGCYNGLGIIYSYRGDYEKSSEYYNKALQNDEEVGKKSNIPNYITNIGINYMRIGKYPKAIANFRKALALYRERDNTLGISSCLKSLGAIYRTQGNYQLALEYNNEALSLAEKIQDSIGISSSLNNIGIIYKVQKKYDKALELYGRSLNIQKNIKNDKVIATIKNNIALIYIEKEEFTNAIEFLNDAVDIHRRLDSKFNLAKCLNNLGYVYVSLKKYDKAHNYYDEAKHININIGSEKGLSYSYLGIADSYMEQKNYDKALPNVLKSLEIADELGVMDYQKDAHKVLSEIYENYGEYEKALSNHKQYKILNDSLFNKENIEKITQLEYEYKYKQQLDSLNINELKLTKIVRDTSQDLENSKRNYLWAIIGVLLLSILLGAIMFYQKLKNAKSKTHTALMEQKLLRSQMTPHFIFNSLSVLQGMILNKEEKKSVHYLSKFSKLLRITLENSRDKTVSLSQELTAVQDYLTIQNLENDAYKCTILVEDSIDVSKFEIPPMLIQPFVENAIEHAFEDQLEDRKIDIRLTYIDKKLICTIADNGIGINFKREQNNKNKNSLATAITSERLKILSKDFNMEGSVTIEDKQKFNEKGTLVTLVIPHKINAVL